MRRFFKATDGSPTVFRASNTRDYRSASFSTRENGDVSISFSAGDGSYPVEEIVRSEYETLVARKNSRIKANGGHHGDGASPRDSWVRKAALEVGNGRQAHPRRRSGPHITTDRLGRTFRNADGPPEAISSSSGTVPRIAALSVSRTSRLLPDRYDAVKAWELDGDVRPDKAWAVDCAACQSLDQQRGTAFARVDPIPPEEVEDEV